MALLPLAGHARRVESRDTVSARRAFIEMPSMTLDMLSKNTRLDMLDYYDNDSIFMAPNNQMGEAFLEKVTPDYLSVRITPASRMQFKVLPVGNGNEILMTIYTTGEDGSARDSEIKFYDASLNPLPSAGYFRAPRIKDFFDLKGKGITLKEIEETLPFQAYAFEAQPGTTDLTGMISIDDILTVEEAKTIFPLARPAVTYVWDGKKYQPVSY